MLPRYITPCASLPLANRTLVYPQYFTAHLWNNVRLCRIRLHRIILSQETLPGFSSKRNTLSHTQIARSEGIIHELARNICASVPQLAGYLKHVESCSKMETVGSIPCEVMGMTSTAIPLTTHFLYDSNPFKRQYDPAMLRTRTDLDSHFPTPRPESLYHILYHLHIISNIEFLPVPMRNWAHGCITWMEASADPEELSQLRAMLNSRTKAGFPLLVDSVFPDCTRGGNMGNMVRFP